MQQGSVEYLHVKLRGTDAASLTAGQVEVSAVARGAAAEWGPVDSYDATTATAKALYGPGTTRGPLPTGQVDVRARITDTPEVVITEPTTVYVYP